MLERFKTLKKSHKVAVVLCVVTIVWVMSGFIFKSSEHDNKGASDAQGTVDISKIIKTEQLTATDRVRFVTVYGATEAKRKVNIKPETEGKLIEIHAKEGGVVKKGDLILTLDPRDRPARIAQTEALVEQRRLEFEAAKSLQKKGFRTEVGLAEAKTNLENAKADLIRAKLDYEHTFVRAPFDGILEKVNADVGDFVAVGFFGGEAALATIVDYNPLLVVGSVSENDRSFITLGGKAKVKLADKREGEGVVSYIGSVADGASRTFRVEVEIANPDRSIPTGLTAELGLPAGSVKAFFVPTSVLSLDDLGAVGVKTVSAEGIVAFNPVKVIEDGKEGIWITGLPDSPTVITAGQAFAREGQSINTTQPVATEPAPEPVK